VTAADLDGNGRIDLVLGNLGRNSFIQASRDQPVRLFVADFAANGRLDQMLTFYKHGESYPIASRDDIVKRNPAVRRRYPTYSAFADSRLDEIFPASVLRSAVEREARVLASAVAWNDGDGTFRLEELPTEAQFSPIRAILVDDFDGDGRPDLLLGGNFHGVTPVRGQYSASYGTLLRGLGDRTFEPVGLAESGLTLEGQVRAIRSIRTADGAAILVARNDDEPLLLRERRRR
jgi:enediyne biosynthesis protein E4